jgi:hypothetical protein
MKFVLVFVVLLMTIGVNLPEGMIARLGMDANWLKAALAAWIFTALVIHRGMALIVLVIFMSLMANLPVDIGIDKDILLGGMVAVAVTPYLARWIE